MEKRTYINGNPIIMIQRKTFAQLTVGDKIYLCREGSMEYQTEPIKKVEGDEIFFKYNDRLKRFKDNNVSWSISWRDDPQYRIFTHEPDAMRYAKAQMMKVLFGKIKSAKNYIEDVKKFRIEHAELLNHQWTIEEINKLEKSLR